MAWKKRLKASAVAPGGNGGVTIRDFRRKVETEHPANPIAAKRPPAALAAACTLSLKFRCGELIRRGNRAADKAQGRYTGGHRQWVT